LYSHTLENSSRQVFLVCMAVPRQEEAGLEAELKKK
jgi:hypothetical protein